MTVEQIASAIELDLHAGLAGTNSNITWSKEALEDEVVSMREAVIREY